MSASSRDSAPLEGEGDLLNEIVHLREALEHRDAIGQAKGIIRFLARCDSQVAFELLKKVSQDTNRRVRDVAVLFADCAGAGMSLPPDVGASWRRCSENGSTVETEPRP